MTINEKTDIPSLVAPVHADIALNFDAHLELTRRIIRQRSISADGSGIQEMAELVAELLRELGAGAEVIPTAGFPVVLGELDAGAPRTLLVYGMYDTMPVEGETWLCDPFAGEVIDLPGLGPSLVARGAENSKGSLAAFLNMVKSWQAVHGRLPVNLKFIIEGEEELGSPSLPAFVERHREQLRADAALYPSFSQTRTGKTVLKLGYKGIAFFRLRVRGGEWGGPRSRAVHSSRAVWYHSPTIVLAEALASLWSADQRRILINGYYDDVAPIPPEDEPLLEKLAASFDSENELLDDDVAKFKWELSGIELLKKYLYEPSLNICGIQSGSVLGSKTILPHEAVANIDFRLVPNQRAERIHELLKAHLDRHGFSQVEIELDDTTAWARTPVSAPVVQAAIRACRDFGLEPEIWPHQAGSSPMYLFTDTLRIPTVPFGLGHGGGAHAPNEYVTLKGLELCCKSFASFIGHWANDE